MHSIGRRGRGFRAIVGRAYLSLTINCYFDLTFSQVGIDQLTWLLVSEGDV